MFQWYPKQARAEVSAAIQRSHGRLMSTAIDLGISRRHLQRILHREKLWPEVEAARARARAGARVPALIRPFQEKKNGVSTL